MKRSHDSAAVNSDMIRKPIQRWAPLFLVPMVAAFLIGFVWPFFHGLFLSFCKFKTTSKWEWVGLSNYEKALADESFIYSFGFTAVFAIVSLVLINVFAFAVAYALTQKIKGANLFRTVFFMPNLIGGIVLGYIWSMIFDGFLGYYQTSILMDKEWGFWGLIILTCWQQIGYMMIIYIAGIQNIPTDILEAARVDGANAATVLFRITIPSVMPSITICLFLTITNSFKLFDQNLALTAGAPANRTQMVALDIYNTFYSRSGYEGVGQAKAVIFFIIVAVIALLQLYLTRRKEVES